MSDDLVKRLRFGALTYDDYMWKAADLIEALERENRLYRIMVEDCDRQRKTQYARAEALEQRLDATKDKAEAAILDLMAERDRYAARLDKAVEALRPFARYADKETCKITMIWKDGGYQSTYTDTLKPEHFFAAHDTLAEFEGGKDD